MRGGGAPALDAAQPQQQPHGPAPAPAPPSTATPPRRPTAPFLAGLVTGALLAHRSIASLAAPAPATCSVAARSWSGVVDEGWRGEVEFAGAPPKSCFCA